MLYDCNYCIYCNFEICKNFNILSQLQPRSQGLLERGCHNYIDSRKKEQVQPGTIAI